MRIIGYGLCGPGESMRFMRQTLECFKNLCDDTIILCNNALPQDIELIQEYGFRVVHDNREWGKNQHIIKENFVRNHVAKLHPDVTICMDMDESLYNVTRAEIEEQFTKGYAWYVYIVNLWGLGWKPDWSFWNVRMWSWSLREELGDNGFFAFEKRPLHCGLAPKWTYSLNLHAPFLLMHRGLMLKDDRQRKIERYEKYDPKQEYRSPLYYQSLADDSYKLLNEEKLDEQIKKDVRNMKQPLEKKPLFIDKEKEVLILREADGFVFSVKESQAKFYIRKGKKFKGLPFSIVDTAPDVEKMRAPLVKKKKLAYVARHNQKGVDDTEGHITRAFEELGWSVIKVMEGQELQEEADVMLYHKSIPQDFEGIKVCWYFDKVFFQEREKEVKEILEKSDLFFTSDGDAFPDNEKVHILRQGVGYDCLGGKKIDVPDVIFIGSTYGERAKWVKELKDKYGDRFKHYNNKFGSELNDICVSGKVFVAPDFPSTENYWSNRVYDLTGRGAFVLHPYKKTLEEEFEGNLAMYTDDMFEQIDYFLDNEEERDDKRIKCRDITREKYTYKDRVKELCSTLSTKMN